MVLLSPRALFDELLEFPLVAAPPTLNLLENSLSCMLRSG